jgi:hypothetical protein
MSCFCSLSLYVIAILRVDCQLSPLPHPYLFPSSTGKTGFANKKAVIPVASSGGVGSGGAANAASSRGKKRVWKRWDATEEEALQRAVEMHGTKDWTAIKQVPSPCILTTSLRLPFLPLLPLHLQTQP